MKKINMWIFPLLLISCIAANANEIKIAFMPDIHFHDVYGKFNDDAFKGLKNSKNGNFATIRTMYAQLTSTRLFNENYFALIAALDDAAAKGIKLIALPGDFSDDGQPFHLRGLKVILEQYQEKYQMQFFATPGNHDPVRPFDNPGGESDFLGIDGKTQRIFSRGAKECADYQGRFAIVKGEFELPTICSEELRELGYAGILQHMAPFGLYPKKEYIYWETPYTQYSTKDYTFDKAIEASQDNNRQYEICHQGTGGSYKKAEFGPCFIVPDTSYLVEPIKDLWLLAIDANVYQPKADADSKNPASPANFSGSGDAGYNKMLTHKQQTIEWMANIAKRAQSEGKTLVVFSHFPMTEFDNGASEQIEDIFGKGKFQLVRSPREDVSRALAATGIKLHVGGHMHFNDTGVKRYPDGSFLFNIQAPSMAAYVPAYKILTFKANNQVEVETVVIENVKRFDELFEHYEQEWQHLNKTKSPAQWNRDVLQAKNYYQFNNWHITELTRLRFLPTEWPCEMKQMLFALNGKDILILSQLDTRITTQQVQQLTGGAQSFEICQQNSAQIQFDASQILSEEFNNAWQLAIEKAEKLAKTQDLTLESFAGWNGFDLAVDFYRLRNADELALRDIAKERLKQYSLLTKTLADSLPAQPQQLNENSDFAAMFRVRFGSLFHIVKQFANGNPARHFRLDLQRGEIVDLAPKIERP